MKKMFLLGLAVVTSGFAFSGCEPDETKSYMTEGAYLATLENQRQMAEIAQKGQAAAGGLSQTQTNSGQ